MSLDAFDIECVFEGVTGIGSIYISNYKAAQNINVLKGISYHI
jgi:hypothetical protein